MTVWQISIQKFHYRIVRIGNHCFFNFKPIHRNILKIIKEPVFFLIKTIFSNRFLWNQRFKIIVRKLRGVVVCILSTKSCFYSALALVIVISVLIIVKGLL